MNSDISSIIDCLKFIPFKKILRVTARVLQEAWKFKHCQKSGDTNTELLPQAELLWTRDAQHSITGLDMGRLSNVDMPYAIKNTVFLPRNHYLFTLIVWDAHERVYHDGIPLLKYGGNFEFPE